MPNLIINNTSIPIATDIDVREINPMFYDKETYTLTFKINATPEVNKTFAFAGYVESCTRSVKLENVILDAGMLQFKGILYVRTANKKEYELYFVANTASSRMKELFVSEIDPTYSLPETAEDRLAMYQDTLVNPDDYDFAFPKIRNSEIITGLTFETFQLYLRVYINDWVVTQSVSPYFKLTKIIDEIFKLANITIVENILSTDDYFKILYAFNNVSHVNFKMDLGTSYNMRYSSDSGVTIIDLYDVDASKCFFTTPASANLLTLWYASNGNMYVKLIYNEVTTILKVTVKANNYFEALEWTGGVVIFDDDETCYVYRPTCQGGFVCLQTEYPNSNFFWAYLDFKGDSAMAEWDKKIFYARRSTSSNYLIEIFDKEGNKIELPDCDIPDATLTPVTITFDDSNPEILMKNHMPEVTLGEYIGELEKFLGLKVFYNIFDNECYIKKMDDIIKSPSIEDITEIICIKQTNKISTPNYNGYKLSCTPDEKDVSGASVVEFPTDTIEKEAVRNNTLLPGESEGTEINDIRLAINERWYYIYTNNLYENLPFVYDNRWVKLSYALSPKKSGDTFFEINSRFSPLFYHDSPFIAAANEPIAFYNTLYNRHNCLRLFMLHDGEAILDAYSNIGYKLEDVNFGLEYWSEYGIYELLYKEWINFNVNIRRDDELIIEWTPEKLIKFKPWQKFCANGNAFFVKAKNYKIRPDNTIKNVKTEVAYL